MILSFEMIFQSSFKFEKKKLLDRTRYKLIALRVFFIVILFYCF